MTATRLTRARARKAGPTRAKLVGLQARYPVLQAVLLVALFTYGAVDLGFWNWLSVKDILVLASLVGLACAGQTLLILMGGFDLSVANFMVVGALLISVLQGQWGISPVVIILIGVVGAGAMGAVAGYICHRLAIQPLIVTLAVGAIAVGLVQALTGGSFAAAAPQWLINLASPATHTFGIDIPPLVVMWIVVGIAMAVFLHRTVGGRRLLATGANLPAAEYSLVKTRRLWALAFAFSAAASLLVGMLVAGFAGSVDASLGDAYLFQGVVAVLIGGTVFGGPGDYTRSIIGALFLTVLNVVLAGKGATQADQNILNGLVILVAVALYGRQRALRDSV